MLVALGRGSHLVLASSWLLLMDSPKSEILMWKELVSRMFSGLMSRWVMPWGPGQQGGTRWLSGQRAEKACSRPLQLLIVLSSQLWQ